MVLDLRLPRHGMAHVELRLHAAPTRGNFPFTDITHGRRVAVRYGTARSVPVFEGEITAIELSIVDGLPELAILAEDSLHRLARRMVSTTFTERTADDVVRSLAEATGLQVETTLGSPPATHVKGAESDLAFLLRMVSGHGAALRIEQGRVRAGPEATDPQPISIQTSTLRELRVIADLNWQPGTVTVRGWNLAQNEVVETTAVPAAQQMQSGAELAAQLGWGADFVVPRDFLEASTSEIIARVETTRAVERFLHGEILATESQLVPGREVEVTGIDHRFAGRYRVGDCRHRFSRQDGLTVQARIARPYWHP